MLSFPEWRDVSKSYTNNKFHDGQYQAPRKSGKKRERATSHFTNSEISSYSSFFFLPMFTDEREDTLREVAACGNIKAVLHFAHAGVNLNSQNKMNGWYSEKKKKKKETSYS